MPTIYIIAGPNGVGKTTFAERFISLEARGLEFVNADIIARELCATSPETKAFEAGRLTLGRIQALIRGGARSEISRRRDVGSQHQVMKLHPWTESQLPPDLEDYQAERALQMGTLDAIHRARECRADFIVEEAGEVKHFSSEETHELERQALANLEWLNQRIVDITNQAQESDALVLKDHPKS